jgi:hypothetical protein
MPDRVMRDELLTSERYWQVSNGAKLTYVHLLLCADDTARFSGKNFTVRASCFPGQAVDPAVMERWLSELSDADLIRLYEVNKERFIFIPRFRQRLRFTNSRYPAPPPQINDLVPQKTDSSQTQDGLKSGSSPQKRREEKRREEEIGAIAPKAKRLSEEEIPSQWVAWCKSNRPELDAVGVFEGFRDYWIAQPGQKGVKADWFATWRNWCRNQRQGSSGQKTDSVWAGAK